MSIGGGSYTSTFAVPSMEPGAFRGDAPEIEVVVSLCWHNHQSLDMSLPHGAGTQSVVPITASLSSPPAFGWLRTGRAGKMSGQSGCTPYLAPPADTQLQPRRSSWGHRTYTLVAFHHTSRAYYQSVDGCGPWPDTSDLSFPFIVAQVSRLSNGGTFATMSL